MSEKHIGKVIQVIGPVLDIQFKDGELPDLLNAIEIDNHGQKLVVEVAQLTGDNVARCIAMSSTDGQQQMLTVHALDQACPPQHLFDLIGLQMADKMAGLTAVSPGIVVCTQLLHMVLAEQINGQGGTGCYGLRRAGLAGGAQLHRCRIASGFPGGGCHLFPDLCHSLPHLFQILFCHLTQSSSV